jgi:AcrR family transcriptional regulator
MRQAGRRGPGRPSLSDEELLDKALDLFLKNGFDRTSIDGITAAAGMAKRTVYARYGSKENLFRAALKRAIEDWIVPIESLRAAEVDDLEQTLLNIGRILVTNIMTPAGLRLVRIANAESGRRPEIGAYGFEHGTAPTLAYLADLLRRRLGPAAPQAHWDAAAIAYMNLVFTGPPTMTAWGMTINAAEIEAQVVFSVRIFLHGLLAQEPAGAT